VIYFFCQNADPDKRTAKSVVATLLGQLLGLAVANPETCPLDEIVKRASIMFDCYLDVNRVSVDTLWLCLKSLLEFVPELTCIVDGLDECDPGDNDRKFLAEKLLELSRSSLKIQVAITSRDLEDVRLLGMENINEISIQTRDIQHDIQKVVEETVNFSSKLLKVKEQVVPAVISGSEGMFLWAKLMLTTLETSTTQASVLSKLHRMPTGLMSIYNRILHDTGGTLTLEELELRQKRLSWTAISYRPFSVNELCVALSIHAGTTELGDEDLILDMKQEIYKLCGPIIQITQENEVRLVHLSAKTALLGEDDVEPEMTAQEQHGRSQMSIDPQKAHRMVAEASLVYLNSPCFGTISTMTGFVQEKSFAHSLETSFLFLSYAASFWHMHVTQLSSPDAEIFQLVESLCQSSNCFTWVECYSTFVSSAPGEFGHHLQVQSKLRTWMEGAGPGLPNPKMVTEGYLVSSIENAVLKSSESFGITDLRTVALSSRLGTLLCFLDKFKEAKEIRIKVLQGYRTLFGDHDERTRRAFTDLGYVEYMLESHAEAESLFYESLGGRMDAEWHHDEAGLETMKELATVYWLQERLVEAERTMSSSINGLIEMFTERHRLVVLGRQYLAAIYRDQGKIEQAVSVATTNQAISVEIQGADHPDTMRGVQVIAGLHLRGENFVEAEAVLNQVFADQMRVLGPSNQDTLWTRMQLGDLYLKLGRRKEAESSYRWSLQGLTLIYSQDNSQPRHVVQRLSKLLRDDGREGEAEELEMDYHMPVAKEGSRSNLSTRSDEDTESTSPHVH
jgi:tetratricopeptide (TPR) repeat protein